MIVVDSSVLVNAVMQSDHAADIDDVLTRMPVWVAPALWRSEVRHAILRYIRHGSLPPREGYSKVLEVEGLVKQSREIRDHHLVLTIAVETGCSAYDSEFVALAMEEGIPLTYDQKLINTFPRIAMTPGEWLERQQN
ncbi:MAG: type II toxin-antitoxin system VapC family toxin [Bacteroidetes bacterium]|nr:type II toxin-antitoxin system VapC family toxin [Bacteroidota bacterium]